MISLPELPLQVFQELTAKKESNCKDISLLNTNKKITISHSIYFIRVLRCRGTLISNENYDNMFSIDSFQILAASERKSFKKAPWSCIH